MLTNAIQKTPDALGFAALDSKASAPLMDQAEAQDIPVIAFDSGVESDVPLTTAATDNKAAAAEAAKHMSELIGGKGKVALVVHDQTSQTGIQRRDGFTEWMKANAPDIELLPVQYGGGDQAKSADIAKSIISSNADLKGFYGANEGSAIGIVKGVQESGKKGVTIVGFDSGKAQLDAIRSGVMAGAITQNPVGMGEELVASAMKAIKGEELPEVDRHGLLLVRQDQHRRPEDQGRPVRVSAESGCYGRRASARGRPRSCPRRRCADPATTLWYDEAATNWESRSLPIGNGALGASVFGGVASEQLTVQREDALDRRSRERAARRRATGHRRARVRSRRSSSASTPRSRSTRRGWRPSSGTPSAASAPIRSSATCGSRRRPLRPASATIAGTSTSPRRPRASRTSAGASSTRASTSPAAADDVIVARLSADQPGRQSFTVAVSTASNRSAALSAEAGRITLAGALNDNGLKYEAQVRVLNDGGTRTDNANGSVTGRGADAVTLVLAAGTDYAPATRPTGPSAARAGHRRPWTRRARSPTRTCAPPTWPTTSGSSTACGSTSASRCRRFPPTTCWPVQGGHRDGRRAQGAGGPLLPVRPLPAGRLLARRLAAGEPAGRLEQLDVAAVERRLPREHQPADELLARRRHQPGRDDRAVLRLRRRARRRRAR